MYDTVGERGITVIPNFTRQLNFKPLGVALMPAGQGRILYLAVTLDKAPNSPPELHAELVVGRGNAQWVATLTADPSDPKRYYISHDFNAIGLPFRLETGETGRGNTNLHLVVVDPGLAASLNWTAGISA